MSSRFLSYDAIRNLLKKILKQVETNEDDIEWLKAHGGGGEGGGDFFAVGSVPMTGDLNLDENVITNVGGLKIDPENLKTSDGKPFTSWLSGTEFILYYDSSNGDTNPNSTYMKKIESGLSWDNTISIIVSIYDTNNYTQQRLLNEYIKAGDLITVSTIVNYFDITYKILSIEEQGEGLFFKIGMKRYTDSSQSLYISLENGDPVKLSFTKNQFVDLTEPQTIHGAKSFSYLKSSQIPTVDYDVVNLKYFNANIHKNTVSIFRQFGEGKPLTMGNQVGLFNDVVGSENNFLINENNLTISYEDNVCIFSNFSTGCYEIDISVPLQHENNTDEREYVVTTLINNTYTGLSRNYGKFFGTNGSQIPFAYILKLHEIIYINTNDNLRFNIQDLGTVSGGFGVGVSGVFSRMYIKKVSNSTLQMELSDG